MRFLLLLLLGLSAATARGAVYIVGDASPECTHQTLQAALDAAKANGPGLDTIYATRAASYVDARPKIIDHSVWVIGGFDDCTLSASGDRTHIQGTAANPDSVFEIFTVAPPGFRLTVILQNLWISGGFRTSSTVGASS